MIREKYLKPTLILLIIFALTVSGCASAPQNDEESLGNGSEDLKSGNQTEGTVPIESSTLVSVVEVVDGDTVDIKFSNGSIDTVRLLGVDTPEKYGENNPEEFQGISDPDYLHEWGVKASEFTKKLLDKNVYLKYDEEAGKRGYYGRLLAYIYYKNGTMHNQQLIKHGYARVYKESNFKHRQEFFKTEETSKNNYRGIWKKLKNQTKNQNLTIQITETQFNAPGNEYENLNKEWIQVTNLHNKTINLKNWKLKDEANNTYTFPNITIQPNQKIRIHTGKGTNNKTDLYWNSTKPIWNNNGDTATLINTQNQIISKKSS